MQSVVIAGCGYYPYLAALYIQKKLKVNAPKISVIDSGEPIAPLLIQSLSSMRRFHADLGLSEVEFIQKTKAEINLGFEYVGFGGASDSEIFSDVQYGFNLKNRRFHHLFKKLRESHPLEKYEDYCLSAKLARTGRFTPPSSNDRSLYSTVNYGYRLTNTAYKDFISAQLDSNNTDIYTTKIHSISTDGSGFTTSITLKDSTSLSVDLFIDVREPEGGKEALESSSELASEYSKLLEVGLTSTQESSDDFPFSRVLAGQDILSIFGVYLGREYRRTISLKEGRSVCDMSNCFVAPTPWVKNRIALCETFNNRPFILIDKSHLYQSALSRLLELWPRTSDWEVESRNYNSIALAELKHIEDIDQLHLSLAFRRPELLSKEVSHKLELFKQLGKVAYYDMEIVQDQQWPILFNALGVYPECSDFSVSDIPQKWLVDELFKIKSTLAKAAEAAPVYSQFIRSVHR